MIQHPRTPFLAHVFVCTNDRNGARKSCADSGSSLLKDKLKEAVNEKGWKGKVRISSAGCLGVCDSGPNVMIYPQGLWFSEADIADVNEIIAVLTELVEAQN